VHEWVGISVSERVHVIAVYILSSSVSAHVHTDYNSVTQYRRMLMSSKEIEYGCIDWIHSYSGLGSVADALEFLISRVTIGVSSCN
jgi:hypothetical protein